MFNKDCEYPAFWGLNTQGNDLTEKYSTQGANAVWYTKQESETFPSKETVNESYSDSQTQNFKWKYTNENSIYLLNDELDIEKECSFYFDNYSLGNWATFHEKEKTKTDTSIDNNNNSDKVSNNISGKKDTNITNTPSTKDTNNVSLWFFIFILSTFSILLLFKFVHKYK